MADFEKDLRHMKRNDLVEIIYRYQQNEKVLREENETLRNALSDRRIKMSEVGSVAEAALSLNGVFEAAQAAADQYLAEVGSISENAESNARKILEDAQKRADEIKVEAQKESFAMKRKTAEECRVMREEIMKLIKSHDELRNLLKGL